MLRSWLPQRHILFHSHRSSSSCGLREATSLSCLRQLSTRYFRSERCSSVISNDSSVATFEKKSKGQKKREAQRSVDWALAFEKFSDSQIRRAIRWGNLQEEVYEAVVTVKKIGRSGKHARTRQLKLIGGMLRDVDPQLMEGLLKAINDGDVEGVFSKSGSCESGIEYGQIYADTVSSETIEDFESNSDVDEETSENQEMSSWEEEFDKKENDDDIVETWLQGLLSGDSDVVAEVYSIRSEHFNRQELRRLVRATLNSEKQSPEQATENVFPDSSTSFTEVSNARTKLRQYLECFAANN